MKKFWKNKRVLITGHTGFSGGWLSQTLILFGAKVIGISLKPNNKNYLYDLLYLKNRMKSYICDINNISKVKKIIKSEKPEIVFHLAAQSIVNKGYILPIKTFNTNILGTAKLLEAIKAVKSVRSLLIVTSDKCYQNNEKKIFFKENYNLGGDDPYSGSKACQEIITNTYYKSYFNKKVGIATARAGNIIGGADWAENRLMVDAVKAFKNKNKIDIRNPNSIRPWQFILDVLNGYLLLAKKMYVNPVKYSGSWNFGPDDNQNEFSKVIDVIRKINKILKKPLLINIIKSKYNEKMNLFLNSNKSKKLLRWKKKENLDSSIILTINWYQHFFDKKNIKNFTNNQIKKYFNLK